MGRHSIPEAEENLDALIDRAAAGEPVVLVRDGKPVAEIRALPTAPAPGLAGEMLEWLDNRRIRPSRTLTQTSAERVRQMRDEDWR